MPEYVSSHEGNALNDAVGVVLDTIPSSATSSNMLTPVNQVNEYIDDKVWSWVSFNSGVLTIRRAYDIQTDNNILTIG